MECMCAQARAQLYSHPKDFLGNGVRTLVRSKGKIPSTRGSEEDQPPNTVLHRTASPTHYQLRAYPRKSSKENEIFIGCVDHVSCCVHLWHCSSDCWQHANTELCCIALFFFIFLVLSFCVHRQKLPCSLDFVIKLVFMCTVIFGLLSAPVYKPHTLFFKKILIFIHI